MTSRNLLLLLVIFMAQHQDKGDAKPIHCIQSSSCSWSELKPLTQDLYRQALKIYNATITPDNNIVLDDVPRIQCNHLCGPENLVSHPETCLKRIVDVLSYYQSALSHLSTRHKDDDFIRAKKMISDILCHLQGCGYKPTDVTAPKPATEEFLRMKIGSPLLSVSILIARVFSPGNPTHHVIHRVHKH